MMWQIFGLVNVVQSLDITVICIWVADCQFSCDRVTHQAPLGTKYVIFVVVIDFDNKPYGPKTKNWLRSWE